MNKFDDFNSSIDEEMEQKAKEEVLQNILESDDANDFEKELAADIKARQTLADATETMDDVEFGRFIGEILFGEMDSRKNEDYELNPAQFERYLSVLEFFDKITERDKAKGIKARGLEPSELIPKYESAGFTARYKSFSVSGDEIQEFIKIVSLCGIGVDANIHGEAEISGSVPDVYVHKNKDEREERKRRKIFEKTYTDLISLMQSDNFDEYDMCPPEEIGVANYNKKYELNMGQYKKLLSTIEFLEDIVEEEMKFYNKYKEDNEDEECQQPKIFSPIMVAGQTGVRVEAEVVFFSPDEKETRDFCKILSYCSEFEIRWSTDSSIIIQCTIPDVYVLKQ